MRDLVIVRDFRGEPLRRVALSTDSMSVYVSSVFAVEADLAYPPPIGVPCQDVFHWDEAAYARLKSMWRERGEVDREAWARLKTFVG
jgi:hypothetical protein